MSEPPAPADPLIGRTVGDGRYEILAVLGRGGMGTVYRARQRPLDRVVVLKLIHRELSADPGVVGRFQREMKVTAAIEHPNTVRVYDFGEIDGQPFLAMEFLAGRSVREVLDTEGAFAPTRLASIGIGIANALGAAHAAGVVHRDLKPDNVMLLDAYGEPDFVKVLDFGIARPLEQEVGYKTATGVLLGTPIYMSPEQCSGAPVGTRSDLYALGVMLYEMAAGRPPFSGSSFTAVLVAHATTPPPPLAPGLPEELERMIMQLLAKAPEDRPASTDEVVRALAPFGRGAGAGARATGGGARVAGTAAGSLGAARAPTALAPRSSGTLVQPAAARGGTGTRALVDVGLGGASDETSGGGEHDGGIDPDELAPPAPKRRATSAPSPARARRGAPAPPAAKTGKWIGIIVAVLIVAGGGGVAALVLRRGDGGSGGGGTVTGRHGSERGKRPAKKPPEGERPTAADVAVVDGMLAAEGEPAWPPACSPDEGAVRQLGAAARAFGPEADQAQRVTGLAALRTLPEDLAARWLIEARATMAADAVAAGRAAERAATLCPTAAIARHLLGNALQKQQAFDSAQAAYREAARLAPDYAAPRFNLALVQLRRGATADALATLDPLMRTHPDLPNLHLVRADIHRRLGDTAAALADLEEQVKRHPKSADGWFQLGRARAARKLKGAPDAFCQAKDLGHPEAAALCGR